MLQCRRALDIPISRWRKDPEKNKNKNNLKSILEIQYISLQIFYPVLQHFWAGPCHINHSWSSGNFSTATALPAGLGIWPIALSTIDLTRQSLVRRCLKFVRICGSWNVKHWSLALEVDTWCCANWCYVDKECPSAIASLNPGMEGELFWSDNVCVDDPALMLQCPYKPQPNVSSSDTRCNCLNETMPSYLVEAYGLNLTLYADYGQQCGPHDADVCDLTYPTADHAMWCCTSWCWVSDDCPTARYSMVWPGHYWSSESCDLNAEAISACRWDSACECRGQLPAGSFDGKGNFAADYGSSCSAWDAVDCKVVWGSDVDSGWNNSADHDAWQILAGILNHGIFITLLLDATGADAWKLVCSAWCFVPL